MRRKKEVENTLWSSSALIFEKLWLSQETGAHFVLEREKAQTDTDQNLMLKLSHPDLKHKFPFIRFDLTLSL